MFLKISPPHILKNNFSQPTFGTFDFAPTTQANPLGKIKRAKFCQHTKVIYHANK